MNSVTCNSHISILFTERIGVSLLILMPLISLMNIWEVATLNNLSIRGIDLLFLLAWSIWIQHILLYNKIRRNVLLFLGLVLTFFLISLVGLIVLPDYQIHWLSMLRFIQTLLWGALALSFVKSNRDLDIITGNIIVAGAILGLFSIYLLLTHSGLHRIAGFFSAAGGEGLGRQASFNEIGALYALASLLSLCYLIRQRKNSQRWKVITFTIGFVLNIIGLVLVQSRSAFIAFVIGGFVLILPEVKTLLKGLFIYARVNKQAIIYSIIILTSIFILASSIYFLEVNRILRTFLVGSSEYVSMHTRFILWNEGVKVWLNNASSFLLGYGFRSTYRFIEAESAHNFFLNIGLWLGIAGLIPMTILVMWPTIKAAKRIKDYEIARIIIAASSVALVVSMFGNVLVDPFYGGCTFLVLYGAFGVLSNKKQRI